MSGKGGSNRRRNFRRRTQEHDNWTENPPDSRKGTSWRTPSGFASSERQRAAVSDMPGKKKKNDKFRPDKKQEFVERPRWTPVKPPAEPLPIPDCPICGKPIKDISSALSEKNSGEPAHFDCVITKIAEQESLEKGDQIAYIGGGRFGVIHFTSPQDARTFKIKKILEWEDKENRAEWRRNIADHFSVT
jgi:hypothetical protein